MLTKHLPKLLRDVDAGGLTPVMLAFRNKRRASKENLGRLVDKLLPSGNGDNTRLSMEHLECLTHSTDAVPDPAPCALMLDRGIEESSPRCQKAHRPAPNALMLAAWGGKDAFDLAREKIFALVPGRNKSDGYSPVSLNVALGINESDKNNEIVVERQGRLLAHAAQGGDPDVWAEVVSSIRVSDVRRPHALLTSVHPVNNNILSCSAP